MSDQPEIPTDAPPAPEGLRYIRCLGHGASAEVWEAEGTRFGVRYAIKIFMPRMGKDISELRDRFLAEGKLLVTLDHPRIVRVRAYGTDPAGHPFYVMDLVKGPKDKPYSLADAKRDGVDEDRVAAWYDDVREGLVYIHRHGVVHRDLKLQNVLVGADGRAVITDFGAASVDTGALWAYAGGTIASTALRGGVTVMGTIGYMPPEAVMGVAASPATDYYALGVMTYYLLTGSWCDPRTNVRAQLEGYDPEWAEILPQLLHSHPDARKCPDRRVCVEKRLADEAAAEAETRRKQDADANRRLRNARRRGTATAVAVLIASFVAWAVSNALRDDAVAFENLCSIPHGTPIELPENAREGTLTREDYENVMGDVWLSLRECIVELRAGRMTYDLALDTVRKLRKDTERGSAEYELYSMVLVNLDERAKNMWWERWFK